MDVMMVTDRGVPLMCETEGCGNRATSAWYGGWDGKGRRCCDRHNPYANTAMALPVNYRSMPLCHACGQPMNLGQQIIYPGTDQP